MRAIRFREYGGPEVLALEDVPIPQARPGKVLVRVAAAGLNYADVLERRGRYDKETVLPLTAGREIAGTVEVLGEGVTGLSLGQRVMGFARGGFAEYALTIPSLLFPMPDGLDFVRAAALPLQGLTAYLTLTRAGRLQTGETVLVQAAAGGVGLLAVQLAKLLGAGLVIGTASTGAKLELICSKGADVAINYRTDDFVHGVGKCTSGQGADVILEAVGGEVFTQSLDALAPFGRLVVYGRTGGGVDQVDAYRLVRHNQSVLGFALEGYFHQLALVATSMDALTQYVTSGRLDVVISHTFSHERAAEAQAALENRQTVGKVVLIIGER